MASSNFTLRGIPSEVMLLLKREAKRLRISVNALVLKMIKRELGFTCEKLVHRDLDHLAGSWSAEEERVFKENTLFFQEK